MSKPVKLDMIDMRILELLKQDSKMKTYSLAKMVAAPTTTVHNRIKRLEKLGIIKNFTVSIDYAKLGKSITAYTFIVVDYKKFRNMTQREAVDSIAKVVKPDEIHTVTGDYDAMLKMYFESTASMSRTIEDLRRIEGIEKTHTFIVLPFPDNTALHNNP